MRPPVTCVPSNSLQPRWHACISVTELRGPSYSRLRGFLYQEHSQSPLQARDLGHLGRVWVLCPALHVTNGTHYYHKNAVKLTISICCRNGPQTCVTRPAITTRTVALDHGNYIQNKTRRARPSVAAYNDLNLGSLWI